VVRIASKIFNKNMDDYIKGKRIQERGSFRLSFAKKKPIFDDRYPSPGPGSKDVEIVRGNKPGLLGNAFKKEKKDPRLERMEIAAKVADMMKDNNQKEAVNKEIASIASEEPETEERKESFFSKLFKSRRVTETEEEEMKYPVDDQALDPETIEVLKITGKWIMKLDSEMKKEFKESGDYAKYKAFLDKYGLTKKKQ
jgi:hypothetical protein